ncbi:GNAT family N-acetyltransferase [Spirulina subsalsa FACHB-351]|uniref:GNAT family N-acetyltransferase n=1 Tax=Spirulina subsalsa FACHB-351 TaxID=234711 RepID=A0ABT3L6X0_9CYAN|nr:GNAT family N-acetyltransferase [Spirulina subsalsa FACHB-351]
MPMIREAVESDLSAIVQIYNEAVVGRKATADLDPISIESRLTWFHEHTPESYPIWVLEKEGKIAAWLSIQRFHPRPAYTATAELSIYVSPLCQKQGMGRILLQHAIAKSPALGIKTLVGLIFAHNEPSLKLFERFHFSEWGYLPGVAELDGVERDLVIMGRRLIS